MTRLGILLSGKGSNFLKIAHSIRNGLLPGVKICLVISNHMDAPGLKFAMDMGIDAVAVPARGRKRAEQDMETIALLKQYGADLVCLAGYMRLLSPEFVRAFPSRILNIHPSLLPAFPGLEAQKQALDYGVKVTGCTVHFVDEELDHGAIVLQRSVPVENDDTAETLSERILSQEHLAYSEAIRLVTSGAYEVRGRRFVRKDVSPLLRTAVRQEPSGED